VIGHEALGVTVAGGGSGHVTPSNLTGPLAAIRARFGIRNASQPCSASTSDRGGGGGGGSVCVQFADTTKAADIPTAVALAQTADVSIVFVATSAAEGIDRSNLSLSASCQSTVGGACSNPHPTLDQDQLVHAITAAAGPKTVVVAVSPGAILTPWSDAAGAVLAAFMPGQAYGEAIAALLFGERSPSARLPVTFPHTENEQNISQRQFPGYTNANSSLPIQRSCNFKCRPNGTAMYSEKLLVGYRWYHSHGVAPKFCFGHGLTYSNFTYSNLRATQSSVNFTLRNSGSVHAADVPQLYIDFPAAAGEPPRQLKDLGHGAQLLAPGESRLVQFVLTARDWSIWDVETHGWKLVQGEFGVHVGASSCDLRLSTTLDVTA
jgi:beta-glucosidase